MLLDVGRSCLVVVDIQERLLPAMQGAEALVRNARILMETARMLDVPMLASEQYPEGLGATTADVAELFSPGCVAEKIHFSCMADTDFTARLAALDRPQCVVCGIEAHVCVLQTCAGMLKAGYEVFVVADATSSRTPENHRLGMERLRAMGVQVVATEMVCFEWLHRSDAEAFRAVSKLVK